MCIAQNISNQSSFFKPFYCAIGQFPLTVVSRDRRCTAKILIQDFLRFYAVTEVYWLRTHDSYYMIYNKFEWHTVEFLGSLLQHVYTLYKNVWINFKNDFTSSYKFIHSKKNYFLIGEVTRGWGWWKCSFRKSLAIDLFLYKMKKKTKKTIFEHYWSSHLKLCNNL